ncbi:hypothetical protein LIER_16700 [Lithospermum erythrorhizon]|uniref:Uncharacterized protein n=1 Tax=Lithospermum erythrorhizon TaxID=34254 RepID=A0AAV3Q9K0_LITER
MAYPPFFPFQAAFASRALGDGHILLSRQTQHLHMDLTRERLKVRALEQELQELQDQVNNYPWDLALKNQELRIAQAKRDAANQVAFNALREREGLRHTYLQENPWRCRRIGAAVLSDFILKCQDRALTLPALAEEYR